MNVLFVNYGDFTTNSLNHIAGFARGLGDLGHACAVAVPQGKASLTVVPEPRFLALTYAEALERPNLFPDGRAADVVHAWTPREQVRKFVLAYQARAHARLIVHLEDNEEFLLASWMGRPWEEVRELGETELAQRSAAALSHPRRYRRLLGVADGVTVIVDSLRAFVPSGVPCTLLEPGVDFGLYRPLPANPADRRGLGLREAEKAVVFTGSNTFANESEMADLYRAVDLLNEGGTRTRLIRTGVNTTEFVSRLPERTKAHVLDLGFVPKARLPELLAQADALVQPGAAGPFNDYRLPSKLPEYFAMGKPVALPAANLGLSVRDGIDAIVLRTGRPEEIAEACARIFRDPALARTLGENALALARKRFDLAANCRGLAGFYEQVRNAAPGPGSTAAMWGEQTELGLSLQALAARTSDPEAAALASDLAPLVDALERQEVATADRLRLEREIALTHQHAANLTREVSAARKKLPRLEEALRLTRQHAVNLENLRASLQRRIRELDRQCQHLARTIEGRDEILAQREDVIAQREAKLRTMERSFSWRATLPLRFLRRKLLDPFRQAASSPAPALPASLPAARRPEPGPAAPEPAAGGRILRASVDFPQSWSLAPGKILLRGWCYADDGGKLAGVRAVLPGRTVPGTYGLRRPDVAAAAPGNPRAEHSGWQVTLDLTPEDTQLDLEAADEHGAWQAFVRTDLAVGATAAPQEIVTYDQWIEAYDTLTVDQLQAQVDRAAELAYRPLISVLLPVYNTPEAWLRRAIESVRAQTYPHWELCVADDASTDPAVRRVLEEMAAAEPRLKVCHRPENGHISAASNSALELAGGDFVALLDHDDELAPQALFEVAAALNAEPDAGYLFSDEDKIDEAGRRQEPNFKPDWLPDLFEGQNYTSHLSVYRASLMRQVGGFRAGFEGSQDWDLTLRVAEQLAPERIIHIPKILYHWRAVPGSTALLLSEKDYPAQAARKALAEHFGRLGKAVEILPVEGGHWRIKYPLPSELPLVSLIIPTRNALALLRRCVDSLLEETAYPRFEIIVVDNGSDDPEAMAYLAALPSDPRLRDGRSARVLRDDGPFNYSRLNNRAVAEARGELVGLLNNDLEAINPGWLDEMAAQALRPEIGCVGAMLYFPDDTIQHGGCVLGIGGVAGHAFKTLPRGTDGKFNRARLVQNYSAVTAACLVVRRATYRQVGGFDEQALAVAFNDVDFCLKVRAAGYRNLWTPFAEFYHHESATRGADDTPERAGRFRAEVETMLGRWGLALREDPAYNPNLSLEDELFSLASPPRPWVRG
ncbi:MAG TPA: glycosyltransferase [Opitutaceae bacterium]|nr:glycosyltransferase [Opitutaceae bacterium]